MAAAASSPSPQAVVANAGDAILCVSIGVSLQHQHRPRRAPSHTRNAAFLPSLAPPLKRLHLHVKAPSLPPHQRRHASISFVPRAQSNLVRKVTAKELDNILDGTRNCPVVVDFYAHWCGPCKLLSVELEQLAAEYGDTVKFLKVDTDEEFELASEMQIQGLPTLIFVSKDAGKNAIRTEGLLPADVIRTIIENEL